MCYFVNFSRLDKATVVSHDHKVCNIAKIICNHQSKVTRGITHGFGNMNVAPIGCNVRFLYKNVSQESD